MATNDTTTTATEAALITAFEAQARAERSRDLGNALHFCRWRQIERLILLLGAERAIGAVH